MHPLTHHEILALIAPFARRGRHADLAATDRLERRLVFRTLEHPAKAGSIPEHREELQLVNDRSDRFVLTRTLVATDGAQAVLLAEGTDCAALFEQIEAVPPALQLRSTPRGVLASSHVVDEAGALVLTRAAARTDGVKILLTMPSSGRGRADLVLTADLDDPLDLPDDLFAVLGWDWTRLDAWSDRAQRRWTASVALRGCRQAAALDAEGKLERAVAQVADTLAETPGRFHDRHRPGRWLFAFRRSIPFQVSLALLLASLFFTKAGLAQDSVVRMLIFNAPPLLLVAFFCMRELPRIELPRVPRRSQATSWRSGSTAFRKS